MAIIGGGASYEALLVTYEALAASQRKMRCREGYPKMPFVAACKKFPHFRIHIVLHILHIYIFTYYTNKNLTHIFFL